jgi:UDP-3-O-[3-hydroxymyristoyl] glucosamine N-acyltransferase
MVRRRFLARKKGRIDVHVTVNDLAVLVNGTVHGAGERAIRVAEAGSSDVTFVENERNIRLLMTCRAAAVVAPDSLAERISELRGVDGQDFIVVQVKDALAGFVAIVQHLHGQPDPPHPPPACNVLAASSSQPP